MKIHHPALRRTPAVAQTKRATQVEQRPNRTGMPDRLKAGIESLAGFAMDDVRVHYNSAQPARLQALAYTQGADIHVARGQEAHLPHEAWHVVQQKQGRVKPTLQMKGVAINDDGALEREASAMGKRAAQLQSAAPARVSDATSLGNGSHKVSAARDGRSAGSVKLHQRGAGVIEVTDLKAEAAHRGSGIGHRLLASALEAGGRLGGRTVRLDAGDNGSGRLVNWYQQMGFRRTGAKNARGEPSLEASIGKVRGAVAQRRAAIIQRAAPAKVPKKEKDLTSDAKSVEAEEQEPLGPQRDTSLKMRQSLESLHTKSGYVFPNQGPAGGDGCIGKLSCSKSVFRNVEGAKEPLALHVTFYIKHFFVPKHFPNSKEDIKIIIAGLHYTARPKSTANVISDDGASRLTAAESIHMNTGGKWSFNNKNLENFAGKLNLDSKEVQARIEEALHDDTATKLEEIGTDIVNTLQMEAAYKQGIWSDLKRVVVETENW